MDLSDANSIMEAIATDIRQRYGGSVRQMLAVSHKGHPDAFGSCVLLRAADRVFLLTAAHVMDWKDKSSLYLDGSSSLELIEGTAYFTTVREGSTRSDDRIDLAFMELKDKTIAAMGDVPALTPDELDVSDVALERQAYTALGFPWRQTKVDVRRSVVSKPMMVATGIIDHAIYTKLGLEETSHVAFRFDRKRAHVNGRKQMPPHPQGMSGGGVWGQATSVAALEEGRPGSLTGILTEFHHVGAKAILATRVSLFVSAMVAAYPELASHLPTQNRVKINVVNR